MKIVVMGCVSSGGMLHYAENLYKGILEHGAANLVILGPSCDKTIDVENSCSMFIEFSKNKYINKLLEKYNPLFFRKIAKQIKSRFNPDIVHITSYSTGLLSLVNSLKKEGVCVVYTVHDPEPHEEKMTLWGRLFSYYQNSYQIRMVMNRCDSIHVHSALHLNYIKKLYGNDVASKTYVVQHGGGLTETIINGNKCPKELSDIKLGDKCVVLFFGRIEPYKGIDVLLESLRMVSLKTDLIYLIIAGSGSYMRSLNIKGFNNLKIINRFIDDGEINAIFRMSDIVVLPYLTATQTGVIPMAYAYGKPVIATKVGGLPELVLNNETGFMIDKNSSVELCNILYDISSKREMLKSMGVNAMSYLNNHLSWRAISELHIKEYELLLNRGCNRK
jgi:glycosyltransferase involved in cell wall biosynthesis